MGDLSKRITELSAEKRALLEKLIEKKRPAKASDYRASKAAPRQIRTSAIDGHYDVVILGGGLAGLTLAIQLMQTRPDTKILVVEKHKHPVPEAAFKVGESTVELGAHYLGEVLGLKAQLQAAQLPKAGLRYFFSQGDNSDIARRVEFGATYLPPVPSYQLDRGRFENMLRCRVQELGGDFWDACRVSHVLLEPQPQLEPEPKQHLITVKRRQTELTLAARWVVDASGRAGLLKRQLGLAQAVKHDADAVWFRLDQAIDLADWSADAGWQAHVPPGLRRLSTNHLLGRGYWVWLIPLASNMTSIGIVTDAALHPIGQINRFERALAWLRTHEPQCARIIEAQRHQIQDFRALRHYSYSCQKVFSSDRWCLTGEAGVFVDPLYSPGTDFIALSNSYITDFIARDLAGEAIAERVQAYNRIFLNTFESLLPIYEGLYPILGNAQVMTAKIVWDSIVYWGFITLIFFHNKQGDLPFMTGIGRELQRVNHLNARLQNLFRDWDKLEQGEWRDTFIDTLAVDFLYDLHNGLLANLDDAALRAKISQNRALLESVAVAMFRQAVRLLPVSLEGGPINPYGLSLTPERWAEDNLFYQGNGPWPDNADAPPGLTKIWLPAAIRPANPILKEHL